MHYNSFIFGSSRALLGFKPSTFKKCLTANDQPIGLCGFSENIYGIYKKVVFLDKQGVDIKNVLLVLCNFTFMSDENIPGFISRKHYAVTGENYWLFQKPFFDAYTSPNYVARKLMFALTKDSSYLASVVFMDDVYIDPITNEFLNITYEKKILENPEQYYSNIPFPKRDSLPDVCSYTVLNQKKIWMIQEILKIFKKHKTDYRVIISPLYSHFKFHPDDQKILEKLFNGHLYDFSGVNKFNNSKLNFYDGSHFRPIVGDSIMYLIYNPK